MIFKQEFDLSSECQIPDTKSECQGTHWSGRTGMWKDKGCGQAICFVLGKHDLILISAFVLEWLGIQGWPGFAHSTHFSVQAYIFQQGRKFEQGEMSRHWLQTIMKKQETGNVYLNYKCTTIPAQQKLYFFVIHRSIAHHLQFGKKMSIIRGLVK